MATLVLTTVGAMIGGPIGGAIGAVIGQRADQALFAPKPRHGPRLGELTVQTSSYGTAIPKIFGRMRVAGSVIWSTDLQERRSTSGGGKGAPRTANYSYSASFAVALSGRPLKAVHRIWADGKLLRGAAGDFKARTGFRFYPGSEEQEVDPLIASIEGSGGASAFRGIAYALFEDLALEDFGNRIPSLSFEVEADAGPVPIGAIADALSAGAVRDGGTPALAGYAAGGDSVRGALESLSDVVPLWLSGEEGGARVCAGPGAPVPLPGQALVGRREVTRAGAGRMPGEISIAYHDSARDYQLGLQRAVRAGGRRSERRELPAVLDAGSAKAMAEHHLAAAWAGAERARAVVPWRWAQLRPGDHVTLEGSARLWRIERWRMGAGEVALELVGVPAFAPAPAEANPGRPVSAPDLIHGPTLVRLYDLPLGEEARSQPLLVAMAAGAESGWRRAELSASFDEGQSWQGIGMTAAPAVMGSVIVPPGAAPSTLIDMRHAIDVELLNEAMWLESRSDAALAGGANLAVIGGELVQFGRAEPLGHCRFRLSRLLRGRRGTEEAAGAHGAGEPFALVEEASLVPLPVAAAAIGGGAQVMAMGIGDAVAAQAQLRIAGNALRPPSPVHLRAVEEQGGGVRLRWVRRSRLGWSWTGGDTPLAEESELYRVELQGAGRARSWAVSEPAFTYPAEERAADGNLGLLRFAVAQLGTHAASAPARIEID